MYIKRRIPIEFTVIGRKELYVNGIVVALAPFINERPYF